MWFSLNPSVWTCFWFVCVAHTCVRVIAHRPSVILSQVWWVRARYWLFTVSSFSWSMCIWCIFVVNCHTEHDLFLKCLQFNVSCLHIYRRTPDMNIIYISQLRYFLLLQTYRPMLFFLHTEIQRVMWYQPKFAYTFIYYFFHAMKDCRSA